jgi:biopolymer transport protein ExbB/TolQ
VSIILIALSIVSLYLFIERQMVFRKARNKSKQVAPKLAEMLKKGQVQEALTLSSKKENKGSHLARVTAAGIKEFLEGKEANLSLEEQIETAQRGCERASTIFTQELKRGLNTLATIATSAPFIGLFGTIAGIINAFRGMALTGSGGIGAVAGGIAEALVTTAFGIGVAIIALWCYSSLNSKIEVYDAEMSNTTSQIVDFFMRKH